MGPSISPTPTSAAGTTGSDRSGAARWATAASTEPARWGDGGAELLVDPGEFDQPNGLCFSPDQTRLYVNDAPGAHQGVRRRRRRHAVRWTDPLRGSGAHAGGEEDDGRTEAERHADLHNAGALDA